MNFLGLETTKDRMHILAEPQLTEFSYCVTNTKNLIWIIIVQ